jgi:hypothetical protein
MMSEDVQMMLVTGAFFNGSNVRAEVHDGALVVLGAVQDHSTYTGLKDPNVRKITAPTADTASVAIVDFVGVNQTDANGVAYRVGEKTFGLTCPADRQTRVRRLAKGDTFWLADGNFASAPTVGEYAIPTANSTLLTPSSTLVTTKFCVKVEFKQAVTQGNVNTGYQYFCTVETLI